MAWSVGGLTTCTDPPDLLAGEWVSTAYGGPPMIYIFGDEGDGDGADGGNDGGDGEMRWILDLEGGRDTFAVAYRVDRGADPVTLDIGPWDSGPLAGRTLLGIVEFRGPDRMRVDFEPGDPGGEGAERPTDFTEQTVTFIRRRR